MARRAVVVLTDGVDTASRLTPAQVSAKAAAIDVPVYIIATVLPIDDPGSDRATPGAKRQAPASIGTIEDLSRWTGGALYYSSTSASAFTGRAGGRLMNCATCISSRSSQAQSRVGIRSRFGRRRKISWFGHAAVTSPGPQVVSELVLLVNR